MNIVITGGAGFIGSNAAQFYLARGDRVTVFDNLSRDHADDNLAWLRSLGGSLTFIDGDVRSVADTAKLVPFMNGADGVIHLAGQVAVTNSVSDPRTDLETNVFGTFNILESMRASGSGAPLIYASTNKVYGALPDVSIRETDGRYEMPEFAGGIAETQPLDFHSPYGCSKGAADQYVRDYARIYGLNTVVFRQSCIYGPRQFGQEDQGWVAWFLIAALTGKPITIYGSGKQVRDLLYIDDLISAYDSVIRRTDRSRGAVYNIGGGPDHTLSVWKEFQPLLEEISGRRISVTYADSRPGDQPVYVSDSGKFRDEYGWKPTVGVRDGITRLAGWIRANNQLFTP